MAWNELDPSGNYFICYRVGKKKFKRSLRVTSNKTADSLVARVEETKWAKLKGWHVMRHSFISDLACK